MSKSRAFQLGAAALAAAGVLSACSGGNGGVGSIPPSASSSTAGASSSSPASGGSGGEAPTVQSPLPTDAISADPCQGLATDQVTQIGLANPGRPSQGPAGPSCSWKSSTSQFNSVGITVAKAASDGLDSVYASKANNVYFEPTTVSGYPGVYASPSAKDQGDCQLWVGLSDQVAVAVDAQVPSGPNRSNPCPVAERVATAMIQHLQGS